MSLALLFMYGQALSGLPALVPGTTVSVVAEDLRTIYARGVVEDGRLVFDAPLPPGLTVQLLFYPPASVQRSGDAEAAPPMAATAVAPGLQSLRVNVDVGGQDLLVLGGSGDAESFRVWLRQRQNLELVLPAQ